MKEPQEPVELPCHHIYCSACIRVCLDAGQASCPTCRQLLANDFQPRVSEEIKWVFFNTPFSSMKSMKIQKFEAGQLDSLSAFTAPFKHHISSVCPTSFRNSDKLWQLPCFKLLHLAPFSTFANPKWKLSSHHGIICLYEDRDSVILVVVFYTL